MSKATCLGDIETAAARNLLGNRCFGSGLLAISAVSAAKVKTVTNTIAYTIDGQIYTLAPTDNIAFTTLTVQPVSTTYGLSKTGVTDTYYDLSVVPAVGYPA